MFQIPRFLKFTAAMAVWAAVAGCGGGSTPEVEARVSPLSAGRDAGRGEARGPVVVAPYATGLTNPRGLTFGPDGLLYVAEAGTGGLQRATGAPDCPSQFNVYSPYAGGASGRVLRLRPDGGQEVVADGLPSTSDATGVSFGPSDLAFVRGVLYVLIEMGGCSHGLPHDDAAILRVNPDGSTTRVANLAAWLAANPPFFVKDTNAATTDLEPGGVWHSMVAVGDALYVVETNRGMVVRVDPASGEVRRLYDLSRDGAEHNPIVMAEHRDRFYVGTFGEDVGPAELAVFDRDFTGYTLPFRSLNPIVGLAWRRERLFAVEIFPLDNPWSADSAVLVSFNPATGERKELATNFATFPNDLIVGPDGALYTANAGLSAGAGDGSVLRIVVP